MANRRFEQFCHSLIKKKTVICGTASLDTDGSILSQDIPGASLAVSATGLYVLTLEDKYNSCLSVQCSIGENDEDLDAKPGVVDVASAKTIAIHLKTAGVDTDVTATAKLYVHVVLRNSSII
mgnify:CR=1 FL=1